MPVTQIYQGKGENEMVTVNERARNVLLDFVRGYGGVAHGDSFPDGRWEWDIEFPDARSAGMFCQQMLDDNADENGQNVFDVPAVAITADLRAGDKPIRSLFDMVTVTMVVNPEWRKVANSE